MADIHRFDSLAIRGFRGLSDLDISGLGEVNFLLGANDVGKTSIEAILRLSKAQGIQVFVTTHSLEVIEGLQRVLSKKGFSEHRATTKCITLQRDKDGLVRAYRYDYQQFDRCLEHGIEIR